VKIYVYLKSGVLSEYEVESVIKAREHAYQIWKAGYRMRVGNRIEWFGPNWIDKICWDMPNEDLMSEKYEDKA
jgi:hypothetical protein